MGDTAVFIDNAYFKRVCGQRQLHVDYLTFSERLAGGARFRTYVYDCKPYVSNPPTPEERELQSKSDRFERALEKLPRFVTRWGTLQRLQTADGVRFQQKGVDVKLAIDLVKLSLTGKIKMAILVAGDRDFVPAIHEAKEAGVIVCLYYSEDTYVHNELYDACDERVKLSGKLLGECQLAE